MHVDRAFVCREPEIVPGPGHFFWGEEERREVLDVLESGQISRYRFDDAAGTDTPKVFQLERLFERQLGVPHCLAINSGTSALVAGLFGLGLRPGDEVILPGYTFIASMASVVHAGGVPVLAEIDDSLTLDPDDVRRKLTPRTRAIMAVHMLGAPCAMEPLAALAQEKGIALVEDVAQACGGSYRGAMLGSIGAFGAFSFNLFKTITCGDGGLIASGDKELYERAFAYHDHGFKPFRRGLMEADGVFGLNLRMNEMAGAAVLAQARKLPAIIEALRELKQRFVEALGHVRHARRRRLNDASGECATLLVLTFDTRALADAVTEALGARTLIMSRKHYYGGMPQLLNLPRIGGHAYAPGALPRTDDLLARSIALSIGVVDSYLGSSFGVNVRSDDSGLARVAQRFSEATSGIL